MAEEYGTCLVCGAKVPLDMTADHLSEHGVATAEEIRNAPVEIIDDPDRELSDG
jgi:hypothetical protein